MSDVVEDRVTDGRRVAELLSSEVTGREDQPFDRLAVTEAEPDVEPTTDGARAFDISHESRRLGRVFIQPDRARLELTGNPVAARDSLEETDLSWRAAGGEPPRIIVFVPDGVAVKRVLPVLGATAEDQTA